MSSLRFLSGDTLEKTLIDTRGHIGRRWSKLAPPPTNHGNKMNLSMPQNGGSLLALLPRSYFILPILNAVNSDRQLPSSSFSLPTVRALVISAAGCSGIDGLLCSTCMCACICNDYIVHHRGRLDNDYYHVNEKHHIVFLVM